MFQLFQKQNRAHQSTHDYFFIVLSGVGVTIDRRLDIICIHEPNQVSLEKLFGLPRTFRGQARMKSAVLPVNVFRENDLIRLCDLDTSTCSPLLYINTVFSTPNISGLVTPAVFRQHLVNNNEAMKNLCNFTSTTEHEAHTKLIIRSVLSAVAENSWTFRYGTIYGVNPFKDQGVFDEWLGDLVEADLLTWNPTKRTLSVTDALIYLMMNAINRRLGERVFDY